MSIYDYHVLKGLDLSEERVRQLLAVTRTRFYELGEIIHGGEEEPLPWCHVISGMVNACVRGSSNKYVSVNIYGQGSWLGETSIASESPTNYQFQCLTSVRLLCVPHKAAVRAFEEDINFSRYLARLMAWRNHRHTETLALMKSGSPAQRVVMGLAMFAESLSSGNSHLPPSDTQDVLSIPVKQEVLASMCGVSRGVFSDCVQKLSAAGWIELRYATLSLLRVNAWKSFTDTYRRSPVVGNMTLTSELIALMSNSLDAS